MIGFLIAAVIAALVLKGQTQGSTPASGQARVVGTNPPTLGSSLPISSNMTPLSREPSHLTWQEWQNGPFVPVPTGSSQDLFAPATAQTDAKINSAVQLAANYGGGAPQVINPDTGQPEKSGSIASTTTPAGSGGTGTSGSLPTGGFGGGCPVKGTEVRSLGDGIMQITELDEMRWIEIVTQNGYKLTASHSHLLYTQDGIRELSSVTKSDRVVTQSGESQIVTINVKEVSGTKLRIHVPEGHLYWAGGILSHNKPTLIT